MRLPKPRIPLVALFLLALIVRVVGLTWGLPNETRWYSYHPDESVNQVVGAVVHLLQGDFNPHFFNYPSLAIYATWLTYQLLAICGLTTNAFSTDYPWNTVRDVILAGRIFSVVCGALTAPLVYGIAQRLQAGRWAILAGVLAALAPGHVQHSHFATVDVPATFFVVWCFYLTLSAKTQSGLLWAALVAGLAAGTKYNAGLVLIAPLWRAFSLPRDGEQSERLKPLVAIPLQIVLAALGFLVSTPYALLAPREFWGDAKGNGFYFEAFVHPKIGSGDIFQGTGNGWIYHLTFNLPFVLTWPLIIGALAGIYFAARKPAWWPILGFVGVFFFTLGLSQVRFMRYLLPLAPFLCLLAAFGVSQLPRARAGAMLLSLFALWGTLGVLRPFVSVDPRDRAVAVIKSRSEQPVLIGNPWFYTPPFQSQGFNAPVAGVVSIGPDSSKFDPQRQMLVISEFEWREAVRLNPQCEIAQFLRNVQEKVVRTGRPLGRRNFYSFGNEWAMPSHASDESQEGSLKTPFVPHDYLYTNPQIRIYAINKAISAPN